MDANDRSELQVLTATVRALETQVARLSDKFDAAARALELQDAINAKELADHETRIRSVEKWKLSVPVSVLVALATVIGTLLGHRGGV